MGIYLFTHNWFEIQQLLVVHVVLRSGYLFIYTWMVWYATSFSGTYLSLRNMSPLGSLAWIALIKIRIVGLTFLKYFHFFRTSKVWLNTSFEYLKRDSSISTILNPNSIPSCIAQLPTCADNSFNTSSSGIRCSAMLSIPIKADLFH